MVPNSYGSESDQLSVSVCTIVTISARDSLQLRWKYYL